MGLKLIIVLTEQVIYNYFRFSYVDFKMYYEVRPRFSLLIMCNCSQGLLCDLLDRNIL